jgi:4'-phosphopantetheinyl transferase
MNNNLLSWPTSPAYPVLQNDDVHIWLADLNVSENTLKMLANNLNADEQSRAARFVHQKDSSHFIAARAILRDVLSRYTEVLPKKIQFNYGEKGKPSLSVEQNQFEIFFNLAHSYGWAILV